MKDGKVLRSAGSDKMVPPSFLGLGYSPDGQSIVVGPSSRVDSDRRDDAFGVTLFEANLSKHRANYRWPVAGGEPYGCAFTPDGKTLIVTCDDNCVRFYETMNGGLRHVGGAPSEARLFALSPDGRFFTVGGKGKVSVIDWHATAKKAPLGVGALDAAWADIASEDAAKGFRAVVALGADAKKASELIGAKLKPVPKDGPRFAPDLARERRAVEVLEYVRTPAARDVLKALADGAPDAALTRDAKAALARLQGLDSKP